VSGRLAWRPTAAAPDRSLARRITLEGPEGTERREVDSDAEGRFEIHAVAPGAWRLAVAIAEDEVAPSPALNVVEQDVAVGPITIEALAACVFKGRVVDAKDAPVAGALVTLTRGVDRIETRSDDAGSFSFELTGDRRVPGPAVISARLGARVSGASDVDPGASVVLRLDRTSGAVLGELLVPDALRAPTATVTLYAAGSSTNCPVGADGTFHFEDVAPGKVLVSAASGGLRVHRVLEVVSGETARVRLDYRDVTSLVRVHVSGAPADARLALNAELPSRGRGEDAAVSANGSLVVAASPGSVVLHVAAFAPVHLRLTKRVEVAAGATLDAELAWPVPAECGALEGRLAPGSAERVFAASDALERDVALAADGTFKIDLLPPGRYRVYAEPAGNDEPSEIVPLELTVTKGASVRVESVPIGLPR
jgi:hypothetical protein